MRKNPWNPFAKIFDTLGGVPRILRAQEFVSSLSRFFATLHSFPVSITYKSLFTSRQCDIFHRKHCCNILIFVANDSSHFSLAWHQAYSKIKNVPIFANWAQILLCTVLSDDQEPVTQSSLCLSIILVHFCQRNVENIQWFLFFESSSQKFT